MKTDLVKKIENMFYIQMDLNNLVNGYDWFLGYNKKYEDINWKRCIHMECCELINNFPWKHWSKENKFTDLNNARMEVVDIWHFIISLCIEHFLDGGNPTGVIFDKTLIIENYSFDEYINSTHADCIQHEIKQEEVIKATESIMYLVLNDTYISIRSLLSSFFDLCIAIKLSIFSLERLFICKNALNNLRYDFGYQDGKYIKYWGIQKIEDNEFIHKLSLVTKSESPINYKQIYKKIKWLYLETNNLKTNKEQ